MPSKRKAEEDATEENKKLRSAIDDVSDEWVCPITQELPVDPVIAEDGRAYERSAIESWLARARPADQSVKSPVTNEQMGTRLIPAVQIRNSIKRMVESGALSGSKADAWRQRLADEKKVVEERRKAEGGDGEAARRLGHWYRLGLGGLAKDMVKAFQWYKWGADFGDARCTTECGFCYANGHGVAENNSEATMCWGIAAALGSEAGCFFLATCYAHGLHSMPKNEAEAKRWFEKMPGCAVKDVCDKMREHASKWLRELADV